MITAEQAGASGSRRRRVIRLLDFGLARRPEAHPKQEEGDGGVSGSPHYLAPERCRGGAPTVASDVYALGCLGYLLLTGTLPFRGHMYEVLSAKQAGPAPKVRSIVADLPADLAELCDALLEQAPQKRPERGGAASCGGGQRAPSATRMQLQHGCYSTLCLNRTELALGLSLELNLGHLD